MVQGSWKLVVLVCFVTACSESPVAEAKERTPTTIDAREFAARVVTPDGVRVLAVPSPTTRPRVARLDVQVGQDVSEGDALATLEGLTEAKLDLEIAKSELQRAEVEVEWAARPFAPGKKPEDARTGRVAAATIERRRLRTVAEEKRVAVRRAELRAERLRMRSPVSGRVIAIHAYPGESVDPARGLLTLRPNLRAVAADVERDDVDLVEVGAPVTFHCTALPKALEGRIVRVEDYVDVDSDRVRVLATFEGNNLVSHLGATGLLRLTKSTAPLRK